MTDTKKSRKLAISDGLDDVELARVVEYINRVHISQLPSSETRGYLMALVRLLGEEKAHRR